MVSKIRVSSTSCFLYTIWHRIGCFELDLIAENWVKDIVNKDHANINKNYEILQWQQEFLTRSN